MPWSLLFFERSYICRIEIMTWELHFVFCGGLGLYSAKEIIVSELARRTEVPKSNILTWRSGENLMSSSLTKLRNILFAGLRLCQHCKSEFVWSAKSGDRQSRYFLYQRTFFLADFLIDSIKLKKMALKFIMSRTF